MRSPCSRRRRPSCRQRSTRPSCRCSPRPTARSASPRCRPSPPACPDVRFLWIDAHGDFNSPETTPSGFLGGMCLAAACGRWDAGWPETVDPAAVHFLGVRELDPGEREDVAAAGMRTGVPESGPVYVHLDCDGIDPEVMPVQFPVPGGLSLGEVRDTLAGLAAEGRLVGIEVTALEDPVAGRDGGGAPAGPMSILITEVEGRRATGRRWRSRTSSTPPACARRTARRSSATTCRRRRRRRSTLLERAGYAMVGKANLHEFAWGITSENDHYGWVPNPAAPGPRRRRVERRQRGGARGRAGRRGAGQRLRRLDPDPGRLLRRRRLEGQLRRRADRRLLAAGAVLRHGGADGARRRRLRADDGGDGAGLRSHRDGARGSARRHRLDRSRRPARGAARAGGRGALPAPHARSSCRCPTASTRASRARSSRSTATCSATTRTSTARPSRPRCAPR